MGIVGKIVGGTIGLALGGPLGAIAGAVFGHAFDAGQEDLTQDRHAYLSSLESSQLAFFVSTFSMLAKLAQADGRVSEKEVATVQSFATHHLGLKPPDWQVAFNIFRTALDSPATFEDFARQFHQLFRHEPQMLEMMIDFLMQVSVADGELNPAEEALIQSAVGLFNLSNAHYQQIKARYLHSDDRAYQILGCRSSDDSETIKKKYRALAQSYHPDKIAGIGLPDEFTRLAEEKFREIQAAYETIKKERGIR
ncbi:MAG: DnaJ domain-containing protein [Desulfatitalea sp.]|nr:TerB family tellurite resistance protein [Desulfatitalea sp.]NNK00432.1 DnaJ domain-containing protein [Desulfatitalea sp.]